MPRATKDSTTPELREARYVRATRPVTVELHQPVASGEVRTITGRVLGEMHVDGKLHHYRVESTSGVIFVTPPGWLTPESVAALFDTEVTLPKDDERLRRLLVLETAYCLARNAYNRAYAYAREIGWEPPAL